MGAETDGPLYILIAFEAIEDSLLLYQICCLL